jgi:hypothetical protein
MNSFYNFLLISKKNDDAFRIREEIERNRLYQVQITETAHGAIERISNAEINCLVFNFDNFMMDKIRFVTDLRELGHNFPIVIFATHVQKEALEIIRKMDRAVIIEKPFEAKDVWGICQKFVQGRKVHQRVFRRFFTNQTAKLEKTFSGETMDGQIFNLSRGGAYLELQSGQVAPGDLIRVTIHLDKMSRAYNVDAQVIWAVHKGHWNGRPAAGVRFMNSSDIYRNLLNRL